MPIELLTTMPIELITMADRSDHDRPAHAGEEPIKDRLFPCDAKEVFGGKTFPNGV